MLGRQHPRQLMPTWSRGYQSVPGAGAGSSSQRQRGALVCPHAFLLDAQERGSVPRRCPHQHVSVHVRAPGAQSQALLSVSCGTEPALCVTPGPVPTQDELQSSLVPGDCCLLAACSHGSPQKLLSLAQGHPQSRSHPQGSGPTLLTTTMTICLGTEKQKPGFDHRDDKTLDKALRLPPKALPAPCRHQELDHRAPTAMGECNYPCLADGEDDLAAQAAQEPDLLAPSSVCSPRQQPPSNPVALPSPSAPGSWELRAHNGPVLWA